LTEKISKGYGFWLVLRWVVELRSG